MKYPEIFLLAAFLLIFSACETTKPPIDLEKEKAVIQALTNAWFTAETNRDIETCLSFLAPEIIVHPGEIPPFSGIDAMRADLEGFFSASFKAIVPKNRSVIIAAAGDMATDFGEWQITWEDENGEMYSSGKSTIIWKKFGSEWKCVHLSYSSTAGNER